MKQFIRNKLIYLLKIAVGVGLIAWILSGVDRQKIIEYFLNLSVEPLILIVILALFSLSLQFMRWRYLVISNADNFTLKQIAPSFFAGFAFRLMIPGGHAEISKIFLIPGKKRSKVIAYGMEKFYQSYIKILLVSIVLPFSFTRYRYYCYAIILVLIILPAILPRLKWLKYFQEREVNNLKVLLTSLLFSVSVFAVMALQYFILLNQVHEIKLWQTIQTVIYLWSSGVIPISISGLGIREGLAIYFLQNYGFPPAYAVTTSLFLFFINSIVPALVGVYFIYKKRTYLKEMKNTMKSGRSLWQEIRNKQQIIHHGDTEYTEKKN